MLMVLVATGKHVGIKSFANCKSKNLLSPFLQVEQLSTKLSSSPFVSIFSILNHPCFFTVYYHFFGVFLSK